MSVEITLNTQLQIISDFLASYLSLPNLSLLLYYLLGSSFRLSKFETFKLLSSSKLGHSEQLLGGSQSALAGRQGR